MSETTLFLPDMRHEPDKLRLVAEAIEGGLYDQHLRFAEAADTPYAALSNAEYGLVQRPMQPMAGGNLRPRQAPIDWRAEATEVLSLPYDTPFTELAAVIHASHAGWFMYLAERFDLPPNVVSALVEAHRSSFTVETLTEDNLPAYVKDIYSVTKISGRIGEILLAELGLWTAEEAAHARTFSIYNEITAIIPPLQYAAARDSQFRAGSNEEPKDIIHTKVYTAIQELLTHVAHKKGAAIMEPVGYELVKRVARDESGHSDLFRKEIRPVIEAYPDDAVRTMAAILIHNTFNMPGARGIPEFLRHSFRISAAGLLTKEDLHTTASRLLSYWGVFKEDRGSLGNSLVTDAAKRDHELLVQKFGRPYAERPSKPGNFVLGQTLTLRQLDSARTEYLQQLL